MNKLIPAITYLLMGGVIAASITMTVTINGTVTPS